MSAQFNFALSVFEFWSIPKFFFTLFEMALFKKMMILIPFVIYSAAVFAGGEISSSGGEYITIEENPWFLGDDPVQYCIHDPNGFSVDRKTLASEVRRALDDWVSTIKILSPYETLFPLPDGKRKNLSLTFVEEVCTETTPLVFHFGSFNEDIKDTLKNKARFTAALAGQKDFDDNVGRVKKGLIWLAPDRGPNRYLGPSHAHLFWSDANTLWSVLLHEIGHIFGFKHHDDGVMNREFPSHAISFGSFQATSRLLIYHKWPNLNQKVCNQNTRIPGEVSRELLDTNLVILWDICLESIRNGLYFSEIKLKFTSEKNLVTEQFTFTVKSTRPNFSRSRSLSGNYFREVVGSPLDYHQHRFIDFQDVNFMGRLEGNNKIVPALLNKRGSQIDLSFFIESEVFGLNFFFENLKPDLKGIREKVKLEKDQN